MTTTEVRSFTACKAALIREEFPTTHTPEILDKAGGLCGECDRCKGDARPHRAGRKDPLICVDCGHLMGAPVLCCAWVAHGSQLCECPKCVRGRAPLPAPTPVDLTDSQFETIRRCLAFGGKVGVTQGRLAGRSRAAFVNKVQAYRMVEAGLLEDTRTEGDDALVGDGFGHAGTHMLCGWLNPTTKGIAAYNAATAKGA